MKFMLYIDPNLTQKPAQYVHYKTAVLLQLVEMYLLLLHDIDSTLFHDPVTYGYSDLLLLLAILEVFDLDVLLLKLPVVAAVPGGEEGAPVERLVPGWTLLAGELLERRHGHVVAWEEEEGDREPLLLRVHHNPVLCTYVCIIGPHLQQRTLSCEALQRLGSGARYGCFWFVGDWREVLSR